MDDLQNNMCTCVTHGSSCSRTCREERKNGVYQQEEHCLPWNRVHWVRRRSVWPWQSWCLHIAHALIAAYRTDPLHCQLGTVAFRSRNDGVLWFHIHPPLYDTYREKTEKNTAHSWALLWGEPTHALWDMRIHWTQQHHNPGIIQVGRLFARWEARPFHEAMGAEPNPGVLHTEIQYSAPTLRSLPNTSFQFPVETLLAVQRYTFMIEEGLSTEWNSGSSLLTQPKLSLIIFQTKQT